MKSKITWHKFFGLTCIKIKEYEDFKKYYFFRTYIWKRKKTEFEKLNDIIKILTDNNTSHNVALDTINSKIDIIENIQREKLETLPSQMEQITALNLSISNLHQKVFPKYKNIHEGKTVVLLATGPTLNNYEPIPDAIHVGVNSAFMFDKVKLDYLFMLDYVNVKKYIAQANEYAKDTCQKFYGLFREYNHVMHIPEEDVIKAKALRYFINLTNFDMNEQFHYDIENRSLASFWSVIFAAAQFTLYTNPAKIYLVGCDCNWGGHFDGTEQDIKGQDNTKVHSIRIMDGWHKFKTFSQIYYPNTEIISINPVGLKGLFKDIYTSGSEENL